MKKLTTLTLIMLSLYTGNANSQDTINNTVKTLFKEAKRQSMESDYSFLLSISGIAIIVSIAFRLSFKPETNNGKK